MNTQKLQSAIREFLKKLRANPAQHEEEIKERQERKAYYQSFSRDRLLAMTAYDLYAFFSKLWAMLIWGNKKYVVDKLISDNGLEPIKKHLADLLFGEKPVEERWDGFLKAVKGLGPATVSELLCYMDPNAYVIFNRTTIRSTTTSTRVKNMLRPVKLLG